MSQLPSSEYTFREVRTRTIMQSLVPIFIDTLTTKTPNYLHHASVYGVTEEDANIQMKLGNTKNRKVTHYSKELVVDTDNVETAEKVWDVCCKNDIYFELYKLNNYKFYLQRDEIDEPSEIMCYQDKQYVINSFADCNVNKGLDTGIYSSPFHICRTKSSIHEITGAKSKLVEINKGSNLISTNHIELKKLAQPQSYNNAPDVNISDWIQFQLLIELATGKYDKNHLSIWKLSKDLAKFCTFDTGYEIAMIFAKSLNYCVEKADRAINQAYGVI